MTCADPVGFEPVDLDPAVIVTLAPGAWCDDDAGNGRPADWLEGVRSKNTAFARLYRATLLCEQRRHSEGEIPPTWSGRLRELRAQYVAAIQALDEMRAAQKRRRTRQRKRRRS